MSDSNNEAIQPLRSRFASGKKTETVMVCSILIVLAIGVALRAGKDAVFKTSQKEVVVADQQKHQSNISRTPAPPVRPVSRPVREKSFTPTPPPAIPPLSERWNGKALQDGRGVVTLHPGKVVEVPAGKAVWIRVPCDPGRKVFFRVKNPVLDKSQYRLIPSSDGDPRPLRPSSEQIRYDKMYYVQLLVPLKPGQVVEATTN